MFNLYQTMAARNAENPDKEPEVTGHDRFSRISERSSFRTKRRSRKRITRRTQSTSDFRSSRNATPSARDTYTRSASFESEDPPDDPAPPLANKINSVVRRFTCGVPATKGPGGGLRTTNQETRSPLRHGGRYEYTALEADSCSHERLELERQARERAHCACQHYLKTCTRYTLIHHLNDIGSRVDKHWFVVRDASIKTERLLTLVPITPNCPIQCNSTTRSTILDLFLALQHPYIYPVLDLEFRESSGQTYAILVLPFNNKGSLKDLIYKSRWQDDWSQKYGQRTAGLPISQVQRLGRQILEALHFLKERGFPPCTHLHSGNIILQNGVARLTGLENTLLGFTSRIHPIIWSRARSEPNAVDSICFGHVLFEMCAGYELCAPQPTPTHLLDVQDYPPVVEVLEMIFHHPERRYPTVEELLLYDFFRNIDLREMRATPLPQAFQARLTSSTLNLLTDIKRHQSGRRGRRSHSSPATEGESSPHRERRCDRRSATPDVARKSRSRHACADNGEYYERLWETQV